MTTRAQAYDLLRVAEVEYLNTNGWKWYPDKVMWIAPPSSQHPGKTFEHAHAVNVQKAADKAYFRK